MTWEQKRQQSYSYLDKYKNEISKESYGRIMQTIGSQAIEDMFSTPAGVENMVKIEKGEATADELIAEYKKEWGLLSGKDNNIHPSPYKYVLALLRRIFPNKKTTIS